jgi:NDP-sugar pyrophosphorylase family protein
VRRSAPVTGVILAAGAGTRLGELGRRFSKAMVPVAGRPLIEWVIDRLSSAGVSRVIVVAHPDDTALAAYLGVRPDVTLVLQRERLGIADALRCALPRLGRERGYLACACDSLFEPADIRRLVDRGRREAGRAVIGVLDMGAEATRRRSAVRLAGSRVLEIIEKPEHSVSTLVGAPLYWLPKRFARHLRRVQPLGSERYVSTALNEFLIAGGSVCAVRLRGRFEITTAADVRKVSRCLRQGAAAERSGFQGS